MHVSSSQMSVIRRDSGQTKDRLVAGAVSSLRPERSCNIPARFGSGRGDVGPTDTNDDSVDYPFQPVAWTSVPGVSDG
jgi:hypothetical protein